MIARGGICQEGSPISEELETKSRRRTLQEQLADAITSISGRMRFVYLHLLWFGSWILVNAGWRRFPVFDPFPYGLLTMIVSLEAIFLSTFVLINQNRLSDEAERRADLDFISGCSPITR